MEKQMKHTPTLLMLLALSALCLFLPQATPAQVSPAPSLLNFQGRLAKPDGTPVADGTYSLQFRLFDAATAGNLKWTETLSSVSVHNGVFAVLLGNTSALTSSLFAGNLWLEIKVGTDPPLTPRQQLVSVAYAMKANSVPDGSIGAAQIATGAITSDKLASNALAWLLGGNAGTTAGQFLGTTDSQPLVFGTNNTEQMRLTPTGQLGIGTTMPAHLLDLQANSSVGGQDIHIEANGIPTGYFITNSVTQYGYGVAEFSITMATDNATYSANAASGDVAFVATKNIHFNAGNNVTATMSLIGNRLGMRGSNVVEFGLGVAGKQADAGKIGYQTFTPGALDIVGAGTAGNNRQIKFWNEGGATFAGEVFAPVVTVTGGSDVAEPYSVAPAGEVKALPGMVVCIDADKVGEMKVAGRAYDRTVAGIISGANGIQPGITLRQKGTVADGALPVASIGRVWCWCDDQNGPIEAGDMLTTSDTPGHAMKVTDFAHANGAVIGKAMSSLKSGRGLVLVLVSLK
jgi:hypothetical protein